jgi:hypothetical protein
MELRLIEDDDGNLPERPHTRGECRDNGIRPCPWVSCRYNLYLDVKPSGNLKINFPGTEPDEMIESCALDVADRDGATLAEVGQCLNVTRERTRQIELQALHQLLPRRLERFPEHTVTLGEQVIQAAEGGVTLTLYEARRAFDAMMKKYGWDKR